MCEGGLDGLGNLVCTGVAAQLKSAFVHLAKTRCTNGFAVGQAATVGVDGQLAIEVGLPTLDEVFLLTVFTKTTFGHVHDFSTALGVLHLSDIHFAWAHAGHFECCCCCTH